MKCGNLSVCFFNELGNIFGICELSLIYIFGVVTSFAGIDCTATIFTYNSDTLFDIRANNFVNGKTCVVYFDNTIRFTVVGIVNVSL